MKLIQNTGTQRVIDLMRPHLKHGNRLDCVTPSFSLYAFAEIREALSALERVQLIVPKATVPPAIGCRPVGLPTSAPKWLQGQWRCGALPAGAARHGRAAQRAGHSRASGHGLVRHQHGRPGPDARQPPEPDPGVGERCRSRHARPMVRPAVEDACRRPLSPRTTPRDGLA
jgi:hypothetical protein